MGLEATVNSPCHDLPQSAHELNTDSSSRDSLKWVVSVVHCTVVLLILSL